MIFILPCGNSSLRGSLGHFIGGLVAPCVLISTVMIGFGLSILCVLSTSPYKVTETENDAKFLVAKNSDAEGGPPKDFVGGD